MADILYIVVPCYNEEAVLPETARRLRAKLESLTASEKISEKSRVLFGASSKSSMGSAPCSAG